MGLEIQELLPTMAAPRISPDAAGEFIDSASEIMNLLRDLVRCSGFLLASWDPVSKTHVHRSLASEGFSEATISYANDEYIMENRAFAISHTSFPGALLWRDCKRDWKFQFQGTRIAQEFLIPAGYHEGTTMCLRLPTGRYTGAVHMGWTSAAAPTDERRQILERFRPMLAVVCDMLRLPQLVADALNPNACALIVSSSGIARDLPGRSAGPHLGERGALRHLVLSNLAGWMPHRFLWPDELGKCHKVTLTHCRGGLTVVTEEAASWPFGLSLREVEVLSLIADGASNPEIAKRLYISTRTASTHVEHILHKMGCPTRAKLAAIAVTEGLLFPDVCNFPKRKQHLA